MSERTHERRSVEGVKTERERGKENEWERKVKGRERKGKEGNDLQAG